MGYGIWDMGYGIWDMGLEWDLGFGMGWDGMGWDGMGLGWAAIVFVRIDVLYIQHLFNLMKNSSSVNSRGPLVLPPPIYSDKKRSLQ
ncbi:hypothetical protein RirG_250780 [Rhizophagus irregularis DAOM 197198w]|uniref:Uncharacterized protein n=1 Tax=Rhizophagus irregularis (strain DAOM 197198w) TaxID=1432141 RepID=A0A015JZW0_RHIIW|nr:hypothetical protein RirG_250780 [Rhizophagus irregularis DAOM 197198w]